MKNNEDPHLLFLAIRTKMNLPPLETISQQQKSTK